MSMDLCLASVQHTGTRWCEKVFTDARPKWHVLNFNYAGPRHPHQHHLYVGHIAKGTQLTHLLQRLDKGTPLIMPMRHPYRVEESWRRRETDMYGLYSAYDNMLTMLLQHKPLFLPVDAAPLQRQIAEMNVNGLLRRTLSYPWSEVQNSKGATYSLHIADTEPSEMIRSVRSHPIFTPYYGDQASEDEAIEQDRANGSRTPRLWSPMEHD